MKSIIIKHGTDKHKKILEALNARYQMSDTEMGKRRKVWEESDDEFSAVMPVREADQLRKGERSKGDPQYVTLQIPYSYASLLSAHTYWTSALFARDPVLQFTARHGEPEMNVKAVEALMHYQTTIGQHLAPYYVWTADAGRYGLGVIWQYWEKEINYIASYEEVEEKLGNTVIEGSKRQLKTVKAVTGYEGMRLMNVRPHDYLPDTRVPLTNPERGEFVGRKVQLYWNGITKKKITGQYIEENCGVVKELMKGKSSSGRDDTRGVLPELTVDGGSDQTLISGIDGYEMIVELIPKEWKLGTTEYPEKWVFTVVDKKVIIEARPYGVLHNKFPVDILEPEIEGYTLHKRGLLDIGRPLNDTMNWLVNSHYYNVRQSLEGEVVFDPTRISARDVLDPNPGKRIRVMPQGYGQDIRSMIHTIHGTADVTKTHMHDQQFMESLMQRTLGISDSVMGMLSPGSRKTATEVRTASSSSVNRMKTIVEYFSAVGFSSCSQKMLQTSQQMYDAEKKFRLVGDQMFNTEQFIDVSPEAIAGSFDFVAVDGSLPIDRFAMVNMWTSLFAQVRNLPSQVAQGLDFSRIFEWVANMGGMKNIRQFRVEVVPDAAVEQQRQAGNVVNAGDLNGRGNRSGGSPRQTDSAAAGIPLPKQVPGMGPAG